MKAHVSTLVERDPVASASPWLAASLFPLVAGIGGLVPGAVGLGIAVALVAGGALSSLRVRRANARRRAEADRLLVADAPVHALEWRAAQLTSPRERQRLARSLRSLARSLDGRFVVSAAVVNWPAARPQRRLFVALADRLAAFEWTVAPRDVILVRRFLTDGGSPLYDRDRAGELREELEHALDALERR